MNPGPILAPSASGQFSLNDQSACEYVSSTDVTIIQTNPNTDFVAKAESALG